MTAVVRHCWHPSAPDDADCCWCSHARGWWDEPCSVEPDEHRQDREAGERQRARRLLQAFVEQRDTRHGLPY